MNVNINVEERVMKHIDVLMRNINELAKQSMRDNVRIKELEAKVNVCPFVKKINNKTT